MTTLDAIETLPVRDEVIDGNPNTSAFDELPVSDDDQLVVISSVEGQGELAGTVYFDLDGSGTQDVGEGGIDSWTVFLDEKQQRATRRRRSRRRHRYPRQVSSANPSRRTTPCGCFPAQVPRLPFPMVPIPMQ